MQMERVIWQHYSIAFVLKKIFYQNSLMIFTYEEKLRKYVSPRQIIHIALLKSYICLSKMSQYLCRVCVCASLLSDRVRSVSWEQFVSAAACTLQQILKPLKFQKTRQPISGLNRSNLPHLKAHLGAKKNLGPHMVHAVTIS